MPLIADRPERLQGRHVAGRLPLIALQTGRGRLAKRTACFRRARTWAERRTACKAVFDGLATNPAKRRGTGANGCRDCKANGQRLNGRRAISGDIGRNRRGAFDGGNWRGVAGILAAFDVRHGLPDRLADGCHVERLTGAARSMVADRLAHGRTVAACLNHCRIGCHGGRLAAFDVATNPAARRVCIFRGGRLRVPAACGIIRTVDRSKGSEKPERRHGKRGNQKTPFPVRKRSMRPAHTFHPFAGGVLFKWK